MMNPANKYASESEASPAVRPMVDFAQPNATGANALTKKTTNSMRPTADARNRGSITSNNAA